MIITEEMFVISDTHFGDLDSVANGFDKLLVDNWNKTVSEEDTVLHLGDFTSDDTAEALEEKIRKYGNLLHGRILLIRGNHDTAHKGVYETSGIELVNEFNNPWYYAATGTIKNKKILFSHYPVKDIYTILNHSRIIQRLNYAQLLDENPFKFAIEQLEEIFIKNKLDINIHGHIHNEIKVFDNLINVSPANIRYKPIRLGRAFKTCSDG
jgi:calcineurin-like phosphoesterase family protein